MVTASQLITMIYPSHVPVVQGNTERTGNVDPGAIFLPSSHCGKFSWIRECAGYIHNLIVLPCSRNIVPALMECELSMREPLCLHADLRWEVFPISPDSATSVRALCEEFVQQTDGSSCQRTTDGVSPSLNLPR